MPKIIIIGTDHHNTLSMVRCFGEAGLKTILISYGDAESYVASSIFIEKAYRAHEAKDAIIKLASVIEHETDKPVVIACTDEISSLMDLEYEYYKDKCFFFNAETTGRITHYMDKQRQIFTAGESGFSVPWSFEVHPGDDLPEAVSYPCFVKPKESIHGGKKISVCYSALELKDAMKQYDSNFSVLIQDYIQKEYEIVILGLTINGESFIPGYIKKQRERKGGTTYASVLPVTELPHSLISSAKIFLAEIHYDGLWGLECIKSNDDYYFLELNMRNDATTYAMAVAGVNLPVVYYNSVISGGLTIPANTQILRINSMVEFEDLAFPLKGQMPFLKWYKQFKNSECKYFYSKLDKRPYQIRKRQFMQLIRKKILHF